MFYVLIDTCVWLDLCQDYQQRPLLETLEELLGGGQTELILPRIVIDEFARNKEHVIKSSVRSLSSTFKRVKEAVGKFGDPKEKALVLQHLSEVDHKLPTLGDAVIETVDRVEAIFAQATIIETSDDIKLRAAQRAIDKKAPFHHEGKNGIGDAILIEIYADAVRTGRGRDKRFAFVSHNFKDFSQLTGDNRTPHADIAGIFSKLKSLYFLSLKDTFNRIEPSLISSLEFVQEYANESRTFSAITEAIDEFVTKVWYNRHQIRREKIEDGTIKLVEKQSGPSSHTIQRDIWEGALGYAIKVEQRFGVENLGPWTDFEWGMLSGKLSALRWVLGEDWDELYT